MIRIEGLTRKQKALMDVMWGISDMNHLEAFIASLPRRDGIDAHGLVMIAVQDTLEEQEGLDAYENMAKAIIDRSRLA